MASTSLELSMCLTLSAKTYWDQDLTKEFIYAWEGSFQVKFYKPLNKGKIPWLESTEKRCRHKSISGSWCRARACKLWTSSLTSESWNNISHYNTGGVTAVWCNSWIVALVEADPEWSLESYECKMETKFLTTTPVQFEVPNATLE